MTRIENTPGFSVSILIFILYFFLRNLRQSIRALGATALPLYPDVMFKITRR